MCCSNVLFSVVVCVLLIFSSDVMHIKYLHIVLHDISANDFLNALPVF